jgi:hypothetical protein
MTQRLGEATTNELEGGLAGSLVRPGDSEHEEARSTSPSPMHSSTNWMGTATSRKLIEHECILPLASGSGPLPRSLPPQLFGMASRSTRRRPRYVLHTWLRTTTPAACSRTGTGPCGNARSYPAPARTCPDDE